MAVYAGQWGPQGIEYPNGQHAVNAPFQITDADTGVLATLYADKNKGSVLSNPGNLDETGNLLFFADPGDYILTINQTILLPVVVPLHPDEDVDLGPVEVRISQVEEDLEEQNDRLIALESGGASPIAIQELIDETVNPVEDRVSSLEQREIQQDELLDILKDPVVNWFSGEGEPPAVVEGAGPGDMYVDTSTGTLYQLN